MGQYGEIQNNRKYRETVSGFFCENNFTYINLILFKHVHILVKRKLFLKINNIGNSFKYSTTQFLLRIIPLHGRSDTAEVHPI